MRIGASVSHRFVGACLSQQNRCRFSYNQPKGTARDIMSKTQSKTFVWKHHALTQDFVLLRKQGLALIINLYCYWTHDAHDTGVSINAWFTAWDKSMKDKGIVKDDGSPYSTAYLRIYTNKIRQAVEGGFSYTDIKSIADLEEKVLRVNGKSDKKEMSELDKLRARLGKADKRTRRAIWKELNEEFG